MPAAPFPVKRGSRTAPIVDHPRSAFPLLHALCCPVDRGQLEVVSTSELRCCACGARFPVQDGIALLMPPGGTWSAPESAALSSERSQRDLEASLYDRLVGLRLYSLLEVPALLRHFRPSASDRVVEVGCGTGRLTTHLLHSGAAVIAADHSLESLRRLRGKLVEGSENRIQLVQAEAGRLPVVTGWATHALCAGMLQHVPSQSLRETAVEELARVLQPDGRLALSIYQFVPLLRRWMAREGRHSGAIYFRRFRRDEFLALLAPSFEVRRLTGALIYEWVAHCRKTKTRKP